MSETSINIKRICLMAIPGAFALAILVATPIVMSVLQGQRERANATRLEKLKFYNARLEPCLLSVDLPAVGTSPQRQSDVAIDVFPSFSMPYGLRISEGIIRSYSGDPGFGYPQPPPPPGVAELSDQAEDVGSTLDLSSPAHIRPELGKHIMRILSTEIDHADADRRVGVDGASYIFRYENKCATTWSPEDGTRADKLVRLAEGLMELSQSSTEGAASMQAKIEILLIELESDRLQLDS